MGFKALLAALAAAGTAGQDVGYNLLFETAADDFTNRCVSINKALPAWATGDFIIGSVGLQEFKDKHFVGYLDAFGKYNKFSIKGDQVCATYRIMKTGWYNNSVKEGTIAPNLLFYETEPPRHCPIYDPICNLPPLAPNDNTFVNTVMHNGEMLSLTDSPYMLRMNPETLAVIGAKKWTDKVAGVSGVVGSAHPVKHRKTGRHFDFVGNQNFLNGKVDVVIYGMGEDSPDARIPVADTMMETAPYMHTFGVTENYVILPRMPVKFGLPIGKPMADAFQNINMSKPGPDNAFHVVPVNGGATIVKPLPLDSKLYYVHHANSYESGDDIVIDLTTTPNNVFSGDLTTASEKNKTFRDSCYDAAPPHQCVNVVKRFVMNLKDDKAPTEEIISDPLVKTDFTKINQNFKGLKHCFYYGVQWFTDHKTKASMAVVKYDVCSGKPPAQNKKQWHRKNWYPSEALMVPAPNGAEDEGLLFFTALNGETGESWFMVVDAKTMKTLTEAGPYPRVPFTTHGEFYAKAASEKASEEVIV